MDEMSKPNLHRWSVYVVMGEPVLISKTDAPQTEKLLTGHRRWRRTSKWRMCCRMSVRSQYDSLVLGARVRPTFILPAGQMVDRRTVGRAGQAGWVTGSFMARLWGRTA